MYVVVLSSIDSFVGRDSCCLVGVGIRVLLGHDAGSER